MNNLFEKILQLPVTSVTKRKMELIIERGILL
jgi:hypothetical protein